MGIVSGTATKWTRLRTALTSRRSVWGIRDRVNAISTIGGAVDQQFGTLRDLSFYGALGKSIRVLSWIVFRSETILKASSKRACRMFCESCSQ